MIEFVDNWIMLSKQWQIKNNQVEADVTFNEYFFVSRVLRMRWAINTNSLIISLFLEIYKKWFCMHKKISSLQSTTLQIEPREIIGLNRTIECKNLLVLMGRIANC